VCNVYMLSIRKQFMYGLMLHHPSTRNMFTPINLIKNVSQKNLRHHTTVHSNFAHCFEKPFTKLAKSL
jgi:hypothetical protein